MCPRNHTDKQIDSSAYILSEPEAAPALERKTASEFTSWRKPTDSAPATAQPAQASAVPELLSSVLGGVEAVLEVEAAAAITGAGGACVDIDALTSILNFTILPASCIEAASAMHCVRFKVLVYGVSSARRQGPVRVPAWRHTPKWLSAKWRRHAKIAVRK
jgi:hypothetical protein